MDDKETGRVEAFSDGVFSIAITLLVLELTVPRLGDYHAGVDLRNALLAQWPSYAAYLISFITILIMWVNHHMLFNFIHKIDSRMMFLNGLLLLSVSVIPFPTALLAQHFLKPGAQIACAVYTGAYVLIAITFNVLWRYCAKGRRLIKSSAHDHQLERITRSYLNGPIFYGAAFLASFFNLYLSISICVALAIYFAAMCYAKE